MSDPGTPRRAASDRNLADRRYDSEASTRSRQAPPEADGYAPGEPAPSVRGDDDGLIRVGTGEKYARREETIALQNRQVGRYRIVKLISHGGMSSVYQAIDPHMDRLVALKVCRVSSDDADGDLQRFRTEVRSSARLDHPNIVRILDSGSEGGIDFFVMEFIDGQTLGDYTREHRPPFVQRAVFLRDVAEAVQHAHEHGILHRDIKPGNVIIDQHARPHVTDFGLAKQLGANYQLTMTGEAIGTPNYMPPEQAAGNQSLIGYQSDVWSLGAVLYEVLTTRPPFEGETAHEVLRKVLDEDPIPPRAIDAAIPRELEVIALKCLEKPINRRYQTALDLAADLNRFVTGGAIQARPPSLLYRGRKFVLRHRVSLSIVSLVLLLTTILAAVVLNLKHRQESDWRLAASRSLLGEAPRDARLLRPDLRETGSEPVGDPLGLSLAEGQWLWFARPRIINDVRVEVDVVWTRSSDEVQIALNANRDSPPADSEVPRGYLAVYRNAAGGTCSIRRVQEGAEVLHRSPVNRQAFGVSRLVFQRHGSLLQLFHDGELVEEAHDLLPLSGTSHDRVGLRTLHSDTRIRRVRIFRRPLPELSPPLVAADALAHYGNWRDAADNYLTIYRDFPDSSFAPEALAKAYLCALRADADELVDEADRLLAERFPSATMRRFVLEEKVRRLWTAGRQTDALDLAEELLELDPNSRVLEFLLENRGAVLLEPSRRRIFELLPDCAAALNLDLTDLDLADLSFLADVELRALDVSGNRIDDLSPLTGTGLGNLTCRHNRIYDLAPLAELPLEILDCSYNPVTSLAPLAGSALHRLEARGTAVDDVTPLADVPLKVLRLDHTRVGTLAPLAGLRLSELGVGYTPLADLRGVDRGSLIALDISGTAITELPPLAGGPLRHLAMADTAITELDFLAGADLRSLDISRIPARGFSPLAESALTALRADGTRLTDLTTIASERLEGLSVARTAVADLAPLAASRLHRLDASHTPAADLGPLVGLPLRSLVLRHTAVTDLGPLVAADLDELDVSHTAVADLTPLAASRLDRLALAACPVADLTPLVDQELRELAIPDTRVVDCRPVAGDRLLALDASGLALAEAGAPTAAVLADPLRCRRPLLPALLRADRSARFDLAVTPEVLLAAHRDRDPARLLAACPRFRDRRYLLLPQRCRRAEADELARAWGGQTVDLSDRAEAAFVAERFGPWPLWARISDYAVMLARAAPGAHLQPATDPGRWQDHLAGVEPAYHHGRWRQASGEKRLVLVELPENGG